MFGFVFPFELRESRMDLGLRNAAIVEYGRLKEIIHTHLGPTRSLGDFSRYIGDPFSMVYVGNTNQVKRIRQGVDGFVQVDLESGQCRPLLEMIRFSIS
jgi:hypothetical protein